MKKQTWKSRLAALGLTLAAHGEFTYAAETKPAIPRGTPIIRGEPILPVRTNVTATVTNSVPPARPAPDPVLLTPAQILADRTNAPTLLSFSTLGDFDCQLYTELEPPKKYPTLKLRNPIPEKIKAFNGRRVTLTGFMIPILGDGRSFHEFLLVRDMASCCFGRAPKMNHWVRVRMTNKEPGVRPDEGRPVSVTGVLTVGEYEENGALSAIYQLAGEKQETTLWIEEPAELEYRRPLNRRR